MVDEPAAEELEGGDPACWADEFSDYLGLDDAADAEEPTDGQASPGAEPG